MSNQEPNTGNHNLPDMIGVVITDMEADSSTRHILRAPLTRIMRPANARAGFFHTWCITNSDKGDSRISWDPVFDWPRDKAPDITQGPNKTDIFTGVFDGEKFAMIANKASEMSFSDSELLKICVVSMKQMGRHSQILTLSHLNEIFGS